MKIFYIGNFLRDWNTENYVVHGLQRNGAYVHKRVYTSTSGLNSYASQILHQKPDLVLFSKVASPCFSDLIKWCRNNKITTATWLWDLYWGFRPHKPPQVYADLLFTTDGGHDEQWKSIGANHHTLRQGVHEPEHQMVMSDLTRDLAFFGSRNYCRQRLELTNWLNFTYGRQITWHSTTRGIELNRALGRTKIVIGDSYSSANYWSNRVYEILGRGGFLLFPETPGLEAEFTAGEHYVSYPRGDRAELIRLIRYYLSHDNEREVIRMKGFLKCGEYTYTSRCRELLDEVQAYQAQANSTAGKAPALPNASTNPA